MSEKTAPNETTTAPSQGSSLFGKLLIAAFMLAVIGSECLVAYLLIPSADEVARRAEARMTEKLHKQLGPNDPIEENKTIEVDLGNYSITYHDPNTNRSLRIDFQLFGVVAEVERAELEKRLDRVRHRFRDQVIFEIRNADVNDLSDPSLGLIKRRILEKSNHLLGRAILQGVVFSDFSFVEQ
ncbi:MAG: hypothetical protein KatS3mg110_3127 [Pirellulaceae bacterium]|nr:MAG: hypothetical protein KatS3mg110_3127 [Pirellulaceae bacterium]